MDNIASWIAECKQKGAQGNAEAYCDLAEYYLEAEDDKNAEHYFRLSYENGYREALPGLGAVCLRSDDKKVQTEGFEYVKQAAEEGNDYSFYMLGLCYMNGIGTETDTSEGVKAWERAVDLGVVAAMVDLGKYYSETDGEGNLQRAMSLYGRAENEGSELGAYNLGWVYANRLNDAENAIRHFKKATELGAYDAYWDIARIYYEGEIAEKDLKKALHFFKLGADKGDADSIASLGIMYYFGQGTEEDRKSGIECFKKAAAKGSSTAQVNLAKC